MTLFPRRPIPRIGIAPLTSMFYVGENDRRFHDDFRPELHDSDGLLMHTGSGEWIWRPLRNPREISFSSFLDNNPRGFGLMQRDRTFEHYQDLDLGYEVAAELLGRAARQLGRGAHRTGRDPTGDETNDNIVAYWTPKAVPEPGQTLTWGYRITAVTERLRAASGRGGAEYVADQPARARLLRAAATQHAPLHHRFRRR